MFKISICLLIYCFTFEGVSKSQCDVSSVPAVSSSPQQGPYNSAPNCLVNRHFYCLFLLVLHFCIQTDRQNCLSLKANSWLHKIDLQLISHYIKEWLNVFFFYTYRWGVDAWLDTLKSFYWTEKPLANFALRFLFVNNLNSWRCHLCYRHDVMITTIYSTGILYISLVLSPNITHFDTRYNFLFVFLYYYRNE